MRRGRLSGLVMLFVALALSCSPRNGPSTLPPVDDDGDICRGVDCALDMAALSSDGGDAWDRADAIDGASTSDFFDSDADAMTGGCLDEGNPLRFTHWVDSGISVPPIAEPGADLTAGVALADFDGDGDLDVLTTAPQGTPALFFNDGNGNFEDVTAASGLAELSGATAPAVADVDGDGYIDIYLGRTAGQYLLLNDGAGNFTDVTAEWGLDQTDLVVAAAAFVDFDGDRDLDLYVANWLTIEGTDLVGVPNILYRNDGDRFTALASSPGGRGEPGATNAVTWWDFDGDGDSDLLVGNDFGPMLRGNQLFRNDGPDVNDPDSWRFTELGASAGFAVDVFSMSTTVGDIDNDLELDVYVTNFGFNLLHIADGAMAADEAVARNAGVGHLPDPRPVPLAPPSFDSEQPGMAQFYADYTDSSLEQYVLTSWSAAFFDADQDGWQDLWVSNGMLVTDLVPEATSQPNYLLRNRGDGTFERACWYVPDLRGSSRAGAVGDLDGDGDLDVVYTDTGINGAEAGIVVLRNDDGAGNWLSLELDGEPPNTDAIGARVEIEVDGRRQLRHVDGGQGYLSVSDRRVHFGLGDAQQVDLVEVRWPSGSTTSLSDVGANQRLTVTE